MSGDSDSSSDESGMSHFLSDLFLLPERFQSEMKFSFWVQKRNRTHFWEDEEPILKYQRLGQGISRTALCDIEFWFVLPAIVPVFPTRRKSSTCKRVFELFSSFSVLGLLFLKLRQCVLFCSVVDTVRFTENDQHKPAGGHHTERRYGDLSPSSWEVHRVSSLWDFGWLVSSFCVSRWTSIHRSWSVFIFLITFPRLLSWKWSLGVVRVLSLFSVSLCLIQAVLVFSQISNTIMPNFSICTSILIRSLW